jgi:hypothetical protein
MDWKSNDFDYAFDKICCLKTWYLKLPLVFLKTHSLPATWEHEFFHPFKQDIFYDLFKNARLTHSKGGGSYLPPKKQIEVRQVMNASTNMLWVKLVGKEINNKNDNIIDNHIKHV